MFTIKTTFANSPLDGWEHDVRGLVDANDTFLDDFSLASSKLTSYGIVKGSRAYVEVTFRHEYSLGNVVEERVAGRIFEVLDHDGSYRILDALTGRDITKEA